MPSILHMHWLWVFGAFTLGVAIGWLVDLRAAPRWARRLIPAAIGLVAVAALLAIVALVTKGRLVPAREGDWLALGVILAVSFGIGGICGRALRDLADFVPIATKPGTTATTGTYLFRDMHAGMGAGRAFMRAADGGAVARTPIPPSSRVLTPVPLAGGYTYPKTRQFADATTSRPAEPAIGMRRHWSAPRSASAAGAIPAAPEFVGSKGGYVFPATAANGAFSGAARAATTRAGQLRHWTWRGTAATDGGAGPAPAQGGAPGGAGDPGSFAPARPSAGAQDTSVTPRPAETAGAAAPNASAAAAGAPTKGSSPASTGETRPTQSPGAPENEAPTSAAAAAGTAVADASAPRDTPARSADGAAGSAVSGVSAASPGVAAPPSERSHPAATAAEADPTVRSTAPDATTEDLGSPTSGPSDAGPSAPSSAADLGADAGAGDARAASQSAPATAAPTSEPAATTDRGTATRNAPVGEAEAGATDGGQTSEPRPTDLTAGLKRSPGAAENPGPSATAGPPATSAPPGTGGPSISPAVGGGSTGAAATSLASAAAGGSGAPAADPATAALASAPSSASGRPATIAAVPGEEKHPGARPQGLVAARDERADDLKRIRGIGPQNEGRLHGLGIWHFDQIAAWTPDNVRWVGSYLAFPGRIDREKWVDQAAALAGGGDAQAKLDADVSARPRKPRG